MFELQSLVDAYKAANINEVVMFWVSFVYIIYCYLATLILCEIIKERFFSIIFPVVTLGYLVYIVVACIICPFFLDDALGSGTGELGHAFSTTIQQFLSLFFLAYSVYFGFRNVVLTHRKIEAIKNSDEFKAKVLEIQRETDQRVNGNLPPEQRRPINVEVELPSPNDSYWRLFTNVFAAIFFILATHSVML